MEILLFTDKNGIQHSLTTDSPASHYGIPAYRVNDDSRSDYGPADIVRFDDLFVSAGLVVALWAHLAGRSTAEIVAARKFCSQDPSGPQV